MRVQQQLGTEDSACTYMYVHADHRDTGQAATAESLLLLLVILSMRLPCCAPCQLYGCTMTPPFLQCDCAEATPTPAVLPTSLAQPVSHAGLTACVPAPTYLTLQRPLVA
jgi:hypothetical protein